MNNPQDLADRYAAVWNESNPALRRKGIAELWDPDGAHYVRTLEARAFDARLQPVEQRLAHAIRCGPDIDWRKAKFSAAPPPGDDAQRSLGSHVGLGLMRQSSHVHRRSTVR